MFKRIMQFVFKTRRAQAVQDALVAHIAPAATEELTVDEVMDAGRHYTPRTAGRPRKTTGAFGGSPFGKAREAAALEARRAQAAEQAKQAAEQAMNAAQAEQGATPAPAE